MKTLDEVIAVMDHVEFCCTNCKLQFDCDEVECILEDALHYLKEYHDAYGNVIASMNHHLRKIHELEQNDPLTWEELHTMEGKPIWVESSGSFNRRRWMFVGEWFDDDEMRLFDMGYDYPDYISKNSYESGTWQAYRKERIDERK